MERSPLASLSVLAVLAVLAMAFMWLFALNQVTDTGVAGAAQAIDDAFARSLEPGTKTRITMVRDGTGVAATRRYVVRLRPSAAVASDESAVRRLSERASGLVVNNVSAAKGEVFVHFESEAAGRPSIVTCFRRIGSGSPFEVEAVVPAPPIPTPGSSPADDGAPPTPREGTR